MYLILQKSLGSWRLPLSRLSVCCASTPARGGMATHGREDQRTQPLADSGTQPDTGDTKTHHVPSLRERYVASMTLGAVGDAMGYHNGSWEFCRSGASIHGEVEQLGGVANLKVQPPHFIVSDDTILHIATAEGLTSEWSGDRSFLLHVIAGRYVARANDMSGRAPGPTTMNAIGMLRPGLPNGYRIPFNSRGGGCGAAMRAAPIGLAFSQPDQLDDLIAVAIETGRMTHNHPTGFLGSLAAALFVSYAIQGKPPREWGAGLMGTVEEAWQYVEKAGKNVEENRSNWDYFTSRWADYLKLRGIEGGCSEPEFPEQYGVEERDHFYRSVSFDGWGGASGHDAPMIAYDAILGAGDSWEELCLRAVLHGGDNDSTGIIAGSAWGAMYGFTGVPQANHGRVELQGKLLSLGEKLFEMADLRKGGTHQPEGGVEQGEKGIPKVAMETHEQREGKVDPPQKLGDWST